MLDGASVSKTFTECGWIAERAIKYPGSRGAMVAATSADARDTLCEGDSGLLTMLDMTQMRGGSFDTGYNRSFGEVFLANESMIKLFTAEKPRRLRGPQFHHAVGDEVAFWSDAHKGTGRDTAWSNLNIATRLPAKPGWPDDFESQIVAATTPRPVALLFNRDEEGAPGLMQIGSTRIVRGSTMDNIDNLTDTYRAEVIEPMEGTRLGRQELDGELLWDVEGALWNLDLIDACRVEEGAVPDLYRIVVGVDPAVTSKKTSDLTGIIVAGLDQHWRTGGHGYVLADHSGRYTPGQSGRKVCLAAHMFAADMIAVEGNQGHDYVTKGVTDAWEELAAEGLVDGPQPRVKKVHSRHGKLIRAEPIAAQYEQRRWHHVKGRGLGRFEDEQTTWEPGVGESPDRLDAFVHAATELGSAPAPSKVGLPQATPLPVRGAGAGGGVVDLGALGIAR